MPLTAAQKIILFGGFSPLEIPGLKLWLKSDVGLMLSTTPYAGTGTVTQVGTALTGVGTAFTAEVKVGDTLTGTLISGAVVSITDATHLTLDTSNSGAGAAFTINPTAGVSDRVVTVNNLGGSDNFSQVTASKQPVLKQAVQNGLPVIRFDGVNDILVNATAFLNGTAGAVFFAGQLTSALQDNEYALASFDEGTAFTSGIGLRPYGDSTHTKMATFQRSSADTTDQVQGSTAITAGVARVWCWASTGGAYLLYLNGALETNAVIVGADNGDWFGDTAARDNVTVGGAKANTESLFLKGDMAELLVYEQQLNAAQITQVVRYIGVKWGITVA